MANQNDKKGSRTQNGTAIEAQRQPLKRQTQKSKNSIEHRMSVVEAMLSGKRGTNSGSFDLVGEEKEAQDPEIQKHVQQ